MFILADRPGRAAAFLPGERQVARVAAVLPDVIARLDQHAARADGRVVDAHARLRLDDLDHHADDVGGRVELAALLAGRVGEVLDQVFVGGAEQIGELEVLVAQRDVFEVLDEVDQRVVAERALADLPVEVDVLEHILELILVLPLQLAKRLVERRCRRPPSDDGWLPSAIQGVRRRCTGPDFPVGLRVVRHPRPRARRLAASFSRC